LAIPEERSAFRSLDFDCGPNLEYVGASTAELAQSSVDEKGASKDQRISDPSKRERLVVFMSAGAEGATAPETLRQKNR
jgi:hypothetical protein